MIVAASGGMRISADTQSRVVPGMSVTMAFSRPARVFNNVLLPEFGGPIRAIVQPERISRAVVAILQNLPRLRGDLFEGRGIEIGLPSSGVLREAALHLIGEEARPLVVLTVVRASFASTAMASCGFWLSRTEASSCSARTGCTP